MVIEVIYPFFCPSVCIASSTAECVFVKFFIGEYETFEVLFAWDNFNLLAPELFF